MGIRDLFRSEVSDKRASQFRDQLNSRLQNMKISDQMALAFLENQAVKSNDFSFDRNAILNSSTKNFQLDKARQRIASEVSPTLLSSARHSRADVYDAINAGIGKDDQMKDEGFLRTLYYNYLQDDNPSKIFQKSTSQFKDALKEAEEQATSANQSKVQSYLSSSMESPVSGQQDVAYRLATQYVRRNKDIGIELPSSLIEQLEQPKIAELSYNIPKDFTEKIKERSQQQAELDAKKADLFPGTDRASLVKKAAFAAAGGMLATAGGSALKMGLSGGAGAVASGVASSLNPATGLGLLATGIGAGIQEYAKSAGELASQAHEYNIFNPREAAAAAGTFDETGTNISRASRANLKKLLARMPKHLRYKFNKQYNLTK